MSLKHFILLSIVVMVTMSVPLGCGSQGTTTIFEWTPVGSMEDSVTTPERLSRELEDQKEREDVKRMKRLQENAKRESMVKEVPVKSVTEVTPEKVTSEVKSEVEEETSDSEAEIEPEETP